MSLDARYMREVSGKHGSARVLSISPKMERKMRLEHQIIRNFLAQKDVPAWFRGSSWFQMSATNALYNAIRDDCQQGTSHRVRECLSVIGVTPLVNDEKLKFLMMLSRGNDIAFLWFLMEMQYKTPQSSHLVYSINEQLLMSAIAHLDMITTVRELDRILPRGPSKKEYDRQQKMQQQKKMKKRSQPAPRHEMPYFNKIRRPRMFGKELSIRAPDYKVTFPAYEHYKNPNYSVPNEANRWYANYKMKTSNRVAMSVLFETLDDAVFGPNEEQVIAKQAINLGLDQAFALEDSTKRNLCYHHRQEEQIRELKKMERLVAEREQCRKKLELFSLKKKRKYDDVMAKLEAEIEVYTKQFKKLQERCNDKSYVRVISKNCLCDYLIRDSDHDNCKRPVTDCSSGKNKGGAGELRLSGGAEKPSRHRTSSKKCHSGLRLAGGTEESDKPKGARSSRFSTDGAKLCEYKKFRDSLDKPSNSDLRTGASSLQAYRHDASDTPKSSQMFFEVPVENRPYKFNYEKIFGYNWLDDDRAKIKEMCVEALDFDASKVKNLPDKTPDLGQVVLDCANKDWEKQLYAWRVQYDEKREAEGMKTDDPDEESEDDIPKLDYYDCNDSNLMQRMLTAALKKMCRNPKFVLASMPESNKVPFLREWILNRYGKTYTLKERQEEYNLSVKIFRALEKLALNIKLPRGNVMGRMMSVDYSCRSYVERKAKLIKKEFTELFHKTVMEETRIFWFAMRPSLCTGGPPRNTYFAYMPSRVLDITYFRPWKPNEFMNAKAEWDRRLQHKRMLEEIN